MIFYLQGRLTIKILLENILNVYLEIQILTMHNYSLCNMMKNADS